MLGIVVGYQITEAGKILAAQATPSNHRMQVANGVGTGSIKINKAFAARFEATKRKQELTRLRHQGYVG